MQFIHEKTKNKSIGTNTCQYVLLHHTGAVGDGNISAGRGEAGQVSFHYLVRQNGDIYKFGEHTDILRHAGESTWEGLVGMNQYSIGVEVESKGDVYTEKQKSSTNALIWYLLEELDLTFDKIIRHKDVSPGRKRDISDAFWAEDYPTREDYRLSISESMTEAQILSKIASIELALTENGEAWQDGTAEERECFTQVNNVHRRRLEHYQKKLSDVRMQ